MTRQPRVVVVGSGIAGLFAALRADATGCAVTVLTKSSPDDSNTRWAQGGIAAVTSPDDRVDDHLSDTIVAGAGLVDHAAASVLTSEGPSRIDDLIAWGVGFDRDASGELVRGLEAAHSQPRVLHAGGDATGAEIQRALLAAAAERGIRVIDHTMLVDLVVGGGRVRGVRVISTATDASSEPRVIDADAVVLATGGAGMLYSHTTNPAVATADGIAAAIRAGAAVADLEFVQFHPTVFAGEDPFLISEAVRGEGATLRDAAGHRFLLDQHPDAELAPRDVVARAIAAQLQAHPEDPVLLDATDIHSGDADERAAFLARRFPTIDAALRARGWDWARTPVPVTPAAHYLMGGVVTDLAGRTSIPGLYAVGETARTGVHGANRLASNSLLEGAVFGARAGSAVATDAATGHWPTVEAREISPAAPAAVPMTPPFSRDALQALMWDHAGLVRDERGLDHAAAILRAWQKSREVPRTAREREDANLLLVASRLVDAARARSGSVGAHFRADDPGIAASTLALPVFAEAS